MSTRARLISLCVCAAATTATLYLVERAPTAPPVSTLITAATAEIPTAEGWRPQWAPDQDYLYRLDINTHGSRRAGPQGEVANAVELVSRLRWRAQRAPEGWVATASFEDFEVSRMTLVGQSLPDEALAERLMGHTATVRLDPWGQVISVQVPEGAPPIFAHMMRFVITEAQVIGGAGGEWRRPMELTYGAAEDHWRRIPEGLSRERRYTSLRGLSTAEGAGLSHATTVAVSPEGHVDHLSLNESLEGPELSGYLDLELAFEAREPSVGPMALTQGRTLRPGDYRPISDTRDQILRSQIGDLTAAKMMARLDQFAKVGPMADHSRFIWQAVGLLRLHPELAGALAQEYGELKGSQGRGLILDLLAGAGHAEAQAAMRQVLSDPGLAMAPTRQAMLAQRLGLVKAPTPETVAYLAQHAQDEGLMGAAYTYSLGSAAGHLAGTDEAAQLVADLKGRLSPDADALTRRSVVAALGNARAAGDEVAAFAGDPDPGVRAAVAGALGQSEGPVDALLTLSGDEDSLVQINALESLGERPLEPESWDQVEAGLGGIATSGQSGLVKLLERQLEDPRAEALAHRILANEIEGLRLRPALRRRLAASFPRG